MILAAAGDHPDEWIALRVCFCCFGFTLDKGNRVRQTVCSSFLGRHPEDSHGGMACDPGVADPLDTILRPRAPDRELPDPVRVPLWGQGQTYKVVVDCSESW